MKRVILMCLVALTFIMSCCTVYALDLPPSISGAITLPNGKVAPKGGIKLKVIAESSTSTSSHEYVINEGERGTVYSMYIYSLGTGNKVRCELTEPIEGYYDVSYYTGDSQQPFEYFAKTLTEYENYSDINITLVESRKVTGTLILPNGLTSQSDSSVSVKISAQSDPHFVFDADPQRYLYFSESVNAVIRKGESEGTFEVNLPLYSPGYYFNYKINDYISGVRPDSSILDDRIAVLEDMQLSLPLERGDIIKGKVSLPDGEIAGTGGCAVTVSALYYTTHTTIAGPTQYENYIDREVVIPEGANSANYEITVYREYYEYYMLYSLKSNNYIDRGYYSATGTLTQLDESVCNLEVSGDMDNIDLCILKGTKLGGRIIYPYGQVSPDDLKGSLQIVSNNSIFRDYDFTIKKGSTYTDFEYTMPSDLKDFTLQYYIENGNNICPRYGYYGDMGTTTYSSKTQKLDAQKDTINNLQIPILGYEKITGTIKLPDDMDSFDTNQVLEVNAQDKNDDGLNFYKYMDACLLKPGERSSSFEILVPQDFDEVILSSSVSRDFTSEAKLIIGGYLGDDGMVLDKEDAIFINPGQPNSTGLEIIPIKGERIWGTLTVSDSLSDMRKGGFYLDYSFVNVNGEDSSDSKYYSWVDDTINSKKFFINIPPRYMGEKFVLKIRLNNYKGHEFYLGEGCVTENPKEAKLFTYDGTDLKDLVITIGEPIEVLYGDVNSDGKVNAIDLAKFRCYLLGTVKLNEISFTNSDLNLDGSLNSIDFAWLRYYLLGMIEKLPVN
ncbi:dockerin type I domain-containing protein [Acetivibrio cellulolyticus]|uniref:dockerin type I domain-containing protein n=1 Tax=Acetivibrio cellulolyticus TaxID=35830 RepID=UPI0001E2EB54|nr:dockerin type I domain-containing protein [Acetivibrio cellulolyticus]